MHRTHWILRILVFVLVVQANGYATAAEPNGFIQARLDRIDVAISEEVNRGTVSGVVALVIKDGEVAYEKSFGHADIDAGRNMETDAIFRIASMTKAITSVGIMALYEHGKFQLTDPIAKFAPEFAKMQVVAETDENGAVSKTVPAKRPIRFVDLLTHSSGISYPFAKSSIQQSYVDAGINNGLSGKAITLESQMRLLAQQPLLFEPGSDWSYGLNTDLLGYLIEVISGQPLDRFLRETILDPLGMKDTFFYLPDSHAERLVTLYAWDQEQGLTVAEGNESGIAIDDALYPIRGARTQLSGGAGLSSTARDYARFCQMILNQGEFEGTRILSRKSVELMGAPRIDFDKDGEPDMGLGFAVVHDQGKKGELSSLGSLSWGGAFDTKYWIDPEENLVGVFMSQSIPRGSDLSERFPMLVYQALE